MDLASQDSGAETTAFLPLGEQVGLVTAKVITLFTMAVITFIFGMLPLKLFSQVRNNPDSCSRFRWKLVMSFSFCFAGGVFIGACFLDLLPDVEENFGRVLEELERRHSVVLSYPVAQFVMVSGFFLILMIEQLVLHYSEQWAAAEQWQETERETLLAQVSMNESYQSVTSIGMASTPRHNHHNRNNRDTLVTGVSNEVHHPMDGHRNHSHVGHGVFEHSSLRSVMLLLALSFHSVFEGLAIGLQADPNHMMSIFAAVTIHKAVMSFSLGLNIAQSNLGITAFLTANIIFSLASPLGVAVGIGLSDLPASLAQDCCNGILQGIAAGTFLYITFFEVLPHELNVPRKRLWKVFFVILGFACICGTLLITHFCSHH